MISSSDEDDGKSSVSPLVPKEDIVLFNTVYSVAKEEMPSEKVNSFLQLQRINGVDVQYKN